MTASLYGNIPTPAGSQAVALASDLKALADSIDTRINLLAKNESDRNTRYANVPAGTLVSTVDGWQWLKVSDPPDAPSWVTLSSAEIYTGFSWQAGWADNGNSKIVKSGPNFFCFIGVAYSGAAAIGGASGTFSDVTIATVDETEWRPISGTTPTFVVNGGANFAGEGLMYGSSGSIKITGGKPGTTLNSGDSAFFGFSFMVLGA